MVPVEHVAAYCSNKLCFWQVNWLEGYFFSFVFYLFPPCVILFLGHQLFMIFWTGKTLSCVRNQHACTYVWIWQLFESSVELVELVTMGIELQNKKVLLFYFRYFVFLTEAFRFKLAKKQCTIIAFSRSVRTGKWNKFSALKLEYLNKNRFK